MSHCCAASTSAVVKRVAMSKLRGLSVPSANTDVAAVLGVAPRVALSRDDLAQVVDNPYSTVPSPSCLHAAFTVQLDAIVTAARRARDKGSRDKAQVVGRTLFLHTPTASDAASWPRSWLRPLACGPLPAQSLSAPGLP